MRDITLADIHRHIMDYKVELMGISAMLILLFHVDAIPVVEMVQRRGEIGVDLFLLLGGYTCAMSYCKSDGDLLRFYGRRLRRVYLPFVLFLLLSAIFSVLVFHNKTLAIALNHTVYHMSLALPLWYNELVMWYIPVVLALYLLTPAFIALCLRSRYFVLAPFAVILLSCVLNLRDLSVPMYMLINRGPIYLIGVGLFVLYKQGADIKVPKAVVDAAGIICLIPVLVWSYFNFMDISFLRYLYIPVVLMVVVNYGCKSAALRAFGVISLELYLIQPFVKRIFLETDLQMHPYLNIALEFVLTFFLAYIFSAAYGLLTRRS